jgi:hypothetical protein
LASYRWPAIPKYGRTRLPYEVRNGHIQHE